MGSIERSVTVLTFDGNDIVFTFYRRGKKGWDYGNIDIEVEK
jgi:hypothetical protein